MKIWRIDILWKDNKEFRTRESRIKIFRYLAKWFRYFVHKVNEACDLLCTVQFYFEIFTRFTLYSATSSFLIL